MNRLDKVLGIILMDLEKDAETAKLMSEIKKRTKSHRIEITRSARGKLIILATKNLRHNVKQAIKAVSIKGTATIDEDALEKGLTMVA
jgi:hypothetical protein